MTDPWYMREVERFLDDGIMTTSVKDACVHMLDTIRAIESRHERDETATTDVEASREVTMVSRNMTVPYPATFWELVRYAIARKPCLRLTLTISMRASAGAAISNISAVIDVVDEKAP